LLLRALRRDDRYRFTPGWRRLLLQVSAATAMMLLVLGTLTYDSLRWTDRTWDGRVFHLLLLVAAGMAAYVASLRLFGLRWRHIAHSAEAV
jgi:putative peptidoglycan lipid II flippase